LTVIITASNRFVSLSALDRRVTDETFSIYNNNANKGICLRLRDGVFTVAFTGIAHVNDISSDDWLAGVIMGKDWNSSTPFFELASYSFGGSGCPDYLDAVLVRLHHALSNQIKKKFLFWRYSLEVSVSGLRTKCGYLFPYLLIIRKPRRSNQICYELVGREIDPDPNAIKLYISGGWGERHSDIRTMLESRIASIPNPTSTDAINQMIGLLHYAVKLLSDREPSIGADVMGIAHLPRVNYSKVEFVPSSTAAFSSAFLHGSEAGAAVQYNPWIISPGTRFSPQGIVGSGSKLSANGHEFELAGESLPTTDGTVFATLPLVRR
jgi:hypothetical protein